MSHILKKLLLNNFWTKFAAFLLSLLIWFYVAGEENIEVVKDIPISISLYNDFVITNSSAPIVTITLIGPRETINDIDFSEIVAKKDLSNITTPGNSTFTLLPQNINIPQNTRLTKIQPSEITVRIDKLINKELIVEPVVENQPSSGFAIEEVIANPTIVKIRGPQSILKAMSKINTSPIDLTGRNNSFSQKTKTEPILGEFTYNGFVDVSIYIKELSKQKEFKNVSIRIMQSPTDRYFVKLVPDRAEITITGSDALVPKIEAKDIVCYIDIENVKEGDYELPIQTRMPKGITLLKLKPVNVKVSIKGEPIPVKTIEEVL